MVADDTAAVTVFVICQVKTIEAVQHLAMDYRWLDDSPSKEARFVTACCKSIK
jgi:hypothetical protein